MQEQNADKLESVAFREKLIRLRKSAGLSQKELAEKVSMSQRMLSHYELRASCIPADIIPKIAEALEIRVEELFQPIQQRHSEEIDLLNLDLRTIKIIKTMLNLKPEDRRHIFSMIRLFSNTAKREDTLKSDEGYAENEPENIARPSDNEKERPPEERKSIPIITTEQRSPVTTITIKKKAGRKRTRRKNKNKKYVGKKQLAALLANERLTIYDIAKKLKTEPDIVRKYIHKYNL